MKRRAPFFPSLEQAIPVCLPAMRSDIIARLTDPGVIAVVRTAQEEQVLPVCEALVAGGIVALEITLTVPNALLAIREATLRFGRDALVGVGTVLDAESCAAALNVGAAFVVSPICKEEVLHTAHEADRPVMLGAYTPTEAQRAHEAGADFVKIFPADNLGPGYVRALLAPLPHLRIVPTGGVDLENAAAFFKAGCAAIGVGSSLISTRLVREQNWSGLTQQAREFVKAAREA